VLRLLEDGALREVRRGPSTGLLTHDRSGPEEAGGLLWPPHRRGERCQIGEGGGDVFPDLGIPAQLQTFPVNGCGESIVASLPGKQAEVAK
jgi:hypothetical protein